MATGSASHSRHVQCTSRAAGSGDTRGIRRRPAAILGLGIAMLAIALSQAITASAVPFGSDDIGALPPDAPRGPITKCENRVAKGAGILAAQLVRCHRARAAGKLSSEAAEEACEKAAITTFTARTKTLGCDPCTDLSRVAAAVEGAIEGTSQQLYCAGAATSASVCLTCACGSYRCDNAQLSDVRTTTAGADFCTSTCPGPTCSSSAECGAGQACVADAGGPGISACCDPCIPPHTTCDAIGSHCGPCTSIAGTMCDVPATCRGTSEGGVLCTGSCPGPTCSSSTQCATGQQCVADAGGPGIGACCDPCDQSHCLLCGP